MSSLVIDHAAIIDRIIAILKANTSIFNAITPSATLMRKVIFAETNYDMDDDTTPYIYVQIADQFQFTNEPYGTQVADFEQMQAAYNIGIVTQKRDTAEAQRDISKWTDLVVRQIKAFPRLDDPANPGTDKKAVRTNVVNITRKSSWKSKEKEAAIVTIKCQIGSAWQLVLPGGTTLDLLSKPVETIDKQRDHDILDDSSFAITVKDNPGQLSVEYESTPSTDTTITSLIDGNEKTLSLVHGTVTRTIVAVLLTITRPVPFDNIERTVLTMDTVQ